jgi:hypothetical protein
LCPSCAAKRYELFSRFVLEEVIEEVPHRQLVFTLPKILRRFFIPAKRRTHLAQIMHHVVHAFFCKALSFSKKQKAKTAMVCGLQTFGDELNFHPHLHVLCAQRVNSPGTFCTGTFCTHCLKQDQQGGFETKTMKKGGKTRST